MFEALDGFLGDLIGGLPIHLYQEFVPEIVRIIVCFFVVFSKKKKKVHSFIFFNTTAYRKENYLGLKMPSNK